MGKCKSWREEHASRSFASGRCLGTKEIDLCDCGGDETKCDFYPEKRQKALEERGNLKPCPFCGGEAYIGNLRGGYYVTAHHKDKCHIRPDTWLMSNAPIKKQIKAWNRRVTDEERDMYELDPVGPVETEE